MQGNDNFLRFQLRLKIRNLKEDDQRILWEGIDSLTKMELREACQERGMRSTGLSKEAYKRNLQQWLDLSVNKDVPVSLLIMSRTFFLREEALEGQLDDASKNLTGLADAISGLDKEIVNEVILEVATAHEKISDRDVRKIKLEVLAQQNELIKEEAEAREQTAAKIKEAADKEQIEAHAKEELSSATIESPDIVAATSSVEKTFVETAINVGAPVVEAEKAAQPEKEEKHEKDRSLSAEEMDAISQLISQDPVSKERAELQKIKAAMKAEEKVKEKEKVSEDAVSTPETVAQGTAPDSTSVSGLPMSSEEADKFVADAVASIDGAAAAEAASSTIVTSETSAVPIKPDTTTSDAQEEDEDDPIVARLKKRVASMVGKIEAQLSETEVKIGDKLHFLDKDKDGILSREEMANVLKSVLKRELTSEEALEIADAMVSVFGTKPFDNSWN